MLCYESAYRRERVLPRRHRRRRRRAASSFDSAQYCGRGGAQRARRPAAPASSRGSTPSRRASSSRELEPRAVPGVDAVVEARPAPALEQLPRRARRVDDVGRRHRAILEHRRRAAGQQRLRGCRRRCPSPGRRPGAAEQALDAQHVARAARRARTTRRAASTPRRRSADSAGRSSVYGARRRAVEHEVGAVVHERRAVRARRARQRRGRANALTFSASTG